MDCMARSFLPSTQLVQAHSSQPTLSPEFLVCSSVRRSRRWLLEPRRLRTALALVERPHKHNSSMLLVHYLVGMTMSLVKYVNVNGCR